MLTYFGDFFLLPPLFGNGFPGIWLHSPTRFTRTHALSFLLWLVRSRVPTLHWLIAAVDWWKALVHHSMQTAIQSFFTSSLKFPHPGVFDAWSVDWNPGFTDPIVSTIFLCFNSLILCSSRSHTMFVWDFILGIPYIKRILDTDGQNLLQLYAYVHALIHNSTGVSLVQHRTRAWAQYSKKYDVFV